MKHAGTMTEEVLDRDKPGPVSVSPKGQDHPSYTHNADKSEPIDPHLSDKNPPGKTLGAIHTEDDVLDRDKSGLVSVSASDRGDTSYTYNADKSDPIDPHLADQSVYTH